MRASTTEYQMKLLIVEDDEGVMTFIKKGLSESGYIVDCAYDGEEGIFFATTQSYNLIILDIMLPKANGFEILQTIRGKNIKTPVIFLTAKDDQLDVVKGLTLGADDYIIKPFAFAELLARIQAVLRRGHNIFETNTLIIEDLMLDRLKRTASRNNVLIELSTKEFQLLDYMMANKDYVLTRTMILENVWGYNFDTNSNIIDVHINRLRNKVDKGHDVKLIHTIKGAGYVVKAT